MSKQLFSSPNYTQIPNILFDYWMHVLTHAEFKVLCAIARKTFGWQKTQDHISIKQIEILTGVSRRCIQDCIHVLERHNLIEIIQSKTSDGDFAPNLYRINVIEPDGGGIATSAPPSAAIAPGGSATSALGVVQPLHPQKKEIQKKDKQQQQAVADFPNFLEKKQKPRIYDCLKNIDIDEKVKIKETYANSEEMVKNAIEWAMHPLNPPSKCLAASFRHALKHSLSAKDFETKKKETPYEKVSKHFKNGEMYEGAECYLNSESIAFIRGMKHEQIKLDKFFSWDDFTGKCKQFGIDIGD